MRMGKSRLMYFAYGANLDMKNMFYRCPEARAICPACLRDYKLEFRANSSGAGFATITPEQGKIVPGGLWSITRADLEALDHFEGYPRLYDRKQVIVETPAGKKIKALAYIMTPGHQIAMPSNFYIKVLYRGYMDFGLDQAYLLQAIKETKTKAGSR
jgi:gamma-glutamylcyclotransferase (GGCT)/AIG2-like uncharacterized protein YtfP